MTSLNLFMLIGLRKIVHGASLVRFQLEPVGQETLYVQFVSLVKIGCVPVVGVLGDIEFIGQKRANPSELQDTLAAVHDSQLVLAHKLFATLSSDEFKKTAAAKKNLCGCRSNWRLEAKKSPVVPGK